MMSTLLTTLHVIVSIFLVITVLLQFGKGASVGSSFGATTSQAIFGGAGPQTILSKLTIASAVIFMLTSLYLTYISGSMDVSSVMGDVETVKPLPVEGAPKEPLQ